MGLDMELYIDGQIDNAKLYRLNERIKESLGYFAYGAMEFQVRSYGAALDTMWRYWRPGYERGPWVAIYGIIKLAQAYFPNCVVKYGHDCEDEVMEWTEEREREYWTHFLSDAGDSYHNGRV